MIEVVAGVGSSVSVQTQSGTSTDRQIRALNDQIGKLRAQMAEISKNEKDQKTKEAKLSLIQRQISDLEARIARLRAQKTASDTNATSSIPMAAANPDQEYAAIGANIDVYAYAAEDERLR